MSFARCCGSCCGGPTISCFFHQTAGREEVEVEDREEVGGDDDEEEEEKEVIMSLLHAHTGSRRPRRSRAGRWPECSPIRTTADAGELSRGRRPTPRTLRGLTDTASRYIKRRV